MPIFNPTSFLKNVRRGGQFDPVRDWLILLVCAAFALIIIIVWNIWAFDTIARGGTLGNVATTTPAVFNPSALDAIHDVFNARAEEEAKYRTGVYRYADPSQ